MHILTIAGQSSPVSSGDAVDADVDAPPLHSGAATGEGHSSDLCRASQHQGGQTCHCCKTALVMISINQFCFEICFIIRLIVILVLFSFVG